MNEDNDDQCDAAGPWFLSFVLSLFVCSSVMRLL